MRRAKDGQSTLEFQPAILKETRDHRRRYERIDAILVQVPAILDAVHADIGKLLDNANRQRVRTCKFTSDNVLRLAICQRLQDASLRGIVVYVDENPFLRRFCGFGYGPMMSHTLFCSLKNAIRPETWKEIVGLLTEHAVGTEQVTGTSLRVDTTAYETNIHYPTDSSLLFDVYRTFDRLIRTAREIDPSVAADKRIQLKQAKKIYTAIARMAGKKTKAKTLKRQYTKLFGVVERILEIGTAVGIGLSIGVRRNKYGIIESATATGLIEALAHFRVLGE